MGGVIETKKVGRSTREHFYPALGTAEAKQIRFHDLRHTYASILIKQGENLKYILTLQNKSPILKRKNIFISNHSQLKIDFHPFGYIFCYNWRLLCLAT
jgi:hypothetical protein